MCRVVAGMGVCLTFFASPLRAQPATATLRVSVHSEGHAVPGASVSLSGRLVGATNDEGRLTVATTPGAHAVAVTARGYLDADVTVTLAPGETRDLTVTLEPLPEIEEEVVVSATRSNTFLRDEPLRVEVIDRDEIEEKALMTPGSVAMLLSETTGLRVQTTAPSLGAANVRIQGLRGRYAPLLSDGLPLYGAQAGSLSLLQTPPLDLAQVEVIKGAASALYGPSALAGVVNLVSRRPSTRQTEALVNAVSTGGGDAVLWLSRPLSSGWGLTLLGGAHGQTRRDLDDDGWTDVAGFGRATARPRLFWENGRGRSFFATVGLMGERREGGTVAGGLAPDGRPFSERIDSRRLDGGALGRWLLASGFVVSARGSWARAIEDRRYGDARERGARTAWFGETSIQGRSGRHTWVAGAVVQQDRYDATDLPAFDYTFTTPAVFAQDEVGLGGPVALAASARLDVHSEYGALVSPRLSVLARTGEGWAFRASATSGAFAPTPFTEETEAVGLSRLQPLPPLEAERARGLSLDVTRTAGPLEVTATLFLSRVDHPVQVRDASADSIELVNAAGPTDTWGAEVLARYRREGFVATGTYNYLQSTEPDPEAGVRRDVPLTPPHAASLVAMWEGDDWGRFGIELYYTGRQPLDDDPYRTTGRAYVLAGMLFERRVGRARWFVNVENLANVRQTRWAPLVRPTRAASGSWTVDAWAPLDGTVLNGGVRLGW